MSNGWSIVFTSTFHKVAACGDLLYSLVLITRFYFSLLQDLDARCKQEVVFVSGESFQCWFVQMFLDHSCHIQAFKLQRGLKRFQPPLESKQAHIITTPLPCLTATWRVFHIFILCFLYNLSARLTKYTSAFLLQRRDKMATWKENLVNFLL